MLQVFSSNITEMILGGKILYLATVESLNKQLPTNIVEKDHLLNW